MRILKPISAVAAWSVFAGTFAMTPLAAAIAAERDSSGVIEEVIVMSRRVAESQQDVPIAVTSFSQRDIQRIQPNTLKDMDGFMPNVFIGRQTAGPSMGAIYIRGLGYADVEKNIAPAVGVVVDDLVMGTTTGQLIDMFDVASVEVNRGPQGVLFGKNTTGGTIVVKRIEPQLDAFGGAVSMQFGNYGEQQAKARLNIPIIKDELALKVGVIDRAQDGFYDNVSRGGDVGDISYSAYTAALLWEPSETFSAKLTYDRIDDTSDSVAMDPRYNGDDPFENENDWDAQTDYQQDMFGLTLTLQVGDATLTSITGYIDGNDLVEQDFDSSSIDSVDDTGTFAPVPLAQLHTLRDGTYEQLSQELRLTGDLTDTLQYTVGGFYLESTIELTQETNLIAQLPNLTIAMTPTCAQFGALTPGNPFAGFLFPHPVLGNSFCQTPYAPTPGGPLGDLTGGRSSQAAKEDVTSQALFGALRWSVTETFELAGGVRFLSEEKEFRNNFVSVTPPPPPGFPVRDQESWDDVVFELSANYRITDDNMVYARYAEGFRSGGYAIRSNNVDTLTYDPEDVKTYEVGSKNEFFESRLRLNLTAFYTEVEDWQYGVVLQDPLVAPGTDTVVNNAPETENMGFELEAIAMPIEHLTFIATAGIQDGERSAYFEDPARTPSGPNGTAGSGDPVLLPKTDLTRTPDWNWSLTGIVDWQWGPVDYEASVSARGQDDVILSASNVVSNLGAVGQDGYTLVDARIAGVWTTPDQSEVTVAIFGKNLTDEEYLDFVLPLGATGGFQGWGAPKTYGVEFKWSL
jgi:iron complex outermembrane recepter protein